MHYKVGLGIDSKKKGWNRFHQGESTPHSESFSVQQSLSMGVSQTEGYIRQKLHTFKFTKKEKKKQNRKKTSRY